MVCKFCGQVLMDGAECDCPLSKIERKIQKQIAKAKDAVHAIFGKECEEQGQRAVSEENIEVMDATVERIARNQMYSVSFVFPEGIKAKLTKSAKGAIKVERTETKKDGCEVEE